MREFDLEDRTTRFAKDVIQLCKKLSRNVINIELISQLVRSAGSIGANYREANDALSKKDFVHRTKITRKEAKESQHWLELVLEANHGSALDQEIKSLLDEANQLKKIFSAIIEKSK